MVAGPVAATVAPARFETDRSPVFERSNVPSITTALEGAPGWGEMAARNGNIQAAPAVQFANDPRTPDSTSTAVGAALASNATNDPTGIVGLTTGGKRYVRVGWNVSLTSGTTLATAMVSGIVEFVYT